MKTQFAWKVCEVRNGKLRSAIWHNPVFYSNRRWSKPHAKDSQWLFVLKTRKHARNYIRTTLYDRLDVQKFRIFKCKIKNPTLERDGIDNEGRPYRTNVSWFPEGTLLVDAVKLI